MKSRTSSYEKNISTKRNKTSSNSWFQSPHGNQGWPPCSKEAPRKGPSQIISLISIVPPLNEKREWQVADRGFSKKSRLLNAADYNAVFAKAQFKASCRHFLALAINNGVDSPRLGLVIAKKNISTAVQRNRIKRQIRESFRNNSELVTSLDLVVLARKDADKLDNMRLAQTMNELLRDLNTKVKQVH